MKLNLFERFTIQQILPKEGDFATLKILNALKMTLAPSEEEYKEFEIKEINGLIGWNDKGKEEREIPIGEKATDLIKECLTNLDKTKKLTDKHYTIYEKFIITN